MAMLPRLDLFEVFAGDGHRVAALPAGPAPAAAHDNPAVIEGCARVGPEKGDPGGGIAGGQPCPEPRASHPLAAVATVRRWIDEHCGGVRSFDYRVGSRNDRREVSSRSRAAAASSAA